MITSSRFELRSGLPNRIVFRAGEFGLQKDCVAQAETITPFDHVDLDLASGPIGTLDEDRMRDLIKAIGHVIRSACEPE